MPAGLDMWILSSQAVIHRKIRVVLRCRTSLQLEVLLWCVEVCRKLNWRRCSIHSPVAKSIPYYHEPGAQWAAHLKIICVLFFFNFFFSPKIFWAATCRNLSQSCFCDQIFIAVATFFKHTPCALQQDDVEFFDSPHQWSSIFCGPRTVTPSPCVLVGSARVYRDLSPCQRHTDSWVTHCWERNFLLSLRFLEQLSYWYFAGGRSLDPMKMACSKFTA